MKYSGKSMYGQYVFALNMFTDFCPCKLFSYKGWLLHIHREKSYITYVYIYTGLSRKKRSVGNY